MPGFMVAYYIIAGCVWLLVVDRIRLSDSRVQAEIRSAKEGLVEVLGPELGERLTKAAYVAGALILIMVWPVHAPIFCIRHVIRSAR